MDARLHASTFARGLLLQACWSFERMQNLGFLFCLDPWLRRSYGSGAGYRAAAERHLEFFNTNPYMAGFVVGVIGGMEERKVPAQRVAQVKKAMASALAAVGDPLFWGALRPACAALGLLAWMSAARAGSLQALWFIGGAVFLAAYNAPALAFRWRGVRLGYQWQEELPQRLKAYALPRWTRAVRRTGLAAAALCAGFFLEPLWEEPGKLALGVAALGACAFLKGRGAGALAQYAGALALGLALQLAGVL